jgi:hypothetical protein
LDLTKEICEAKCCAVTLGTKYAHAATFGEGEDLYWDWMRLNMYVRVLERNQTVIKHKKEIVPIEGQTVSFEALLKSKSFLSLKLKQKTVCTHTEIRPCLSDQEICHILEEVQALCQNCNCNCN